MQSRQLSISQTRICFEIWSIKKILKYNLQHTRWNRPESSNSIQIQYVSPKWRNQCEHKLTFKIRPKTAYFSRLPPNYKIVRGSIGITFSRQGDFFLTFNKFKRVYLSKTKGNKRWWSLMIQCGKKLKIPSKVPPCKLGIAKLTFVHCTVESL